MQNERTVRSIQTSREVDGVLVGESAFLPHIEPIHELYRRNGRQVEQSGRQIDEQDRQRIARICAELRSKHAQ